ncbi:hypothetical protein V8C86DRAFT_2582744 [Haematococcus lacustris]
MWAGSEAGAVDLVRLPLVKPSGMCLSHNKQELFLANSGRLSIMRLELSTDRLSVAAGVADKMGSDDGPGAQATFTHPYSLVCLPDGSVLVGDVGAKALRRLVCVENCQGVEPAPEPAAGADHRDLASWAGAVGLGALALVGAVSLVVQTHSAASAWVRQRRDQLRNQHKGPPGRNRLLSLNLAGLKWGGRWLRRHQPEALPVSSTSAAQAANAGQAGAQLQVGWEQSGAEAVQVPLLLDMEGEEQQSGTHPWAAAPPAPPPSAPSAGEPPVLDVFDFTTGVGAAPGSTTAPGHDAPTQP